MQGMRELMRMSLARSLRTLADEDRLAAALPVVCGSATAAQCAVLSLDERGVLHLQVRGPWMGPLESMRVVLLHDLQRVSGVTLHGLQLQRELEMSAVPRKPPMRVDAAQTAPIRRRVAR